MATPVTILRCGLVEYTAATALQQRLIRRRQEGRGGDVLVLLEHPPVVTMGRNARAENLLLEAGALRARGIQLAECDRGGDVTFHGPGQLVGYPILDLRAATPRMGPVDYVRRLEQVLIAVCAACGVPSRRVPGLTGVWTEAEPRRKLAAIGVHFARGVTSHGFALNVNADLAGFATIVPCGIRGHGVTSLREQAGAALAMDLVVARVVENFSRVFQRELAPAVDSWEHYGSEEMNAWP